MLFSTIEEFSELCFNLVSKTWDFWNSIRNEYSKGKPFKNFLKLTPNIDYESNLSESDFTSLKVVNQSIPEIMKYIKFNNIPKTKEEYFYYIFFIKK